MPATFSIFRRESPVSHNVDLLRIARLAVALACLVPAAACTHVYAERNDSIALHAGDAIAANKVAQIIDPWPALSADRNISHDGHRMQRAAERYRNNRTTPLAATSTSSAQYVPVLAPANGGGGGGSSSQ